MAGSPHFDSPEAFNPRYIQLSDIDGSGTADIFYFKGGSVHIWLNQSGNSLAEVAENLPHFLPVDSATNVQVTDLMGRGTSCLVWSSTNPGTEHLQLSYVDLMIEGKPHLLKVINNNMGKETHITYAPSTQFYLEDRKRGAPWITKLPFPVHVIESAETLDLICNTVHHVQYKYHHGFFDGDEREFRGFGYVETLDTKDFNAYDGSQQDYYVKPVLTRTWFHNGAFIKEDVISRQYASEYFSGPGDISGDTLPDTFFDPDITLTPDELREGYRAMKTKTLRQEVWEWTPACFRSRLPAPGFPFQTVWST